MDPAESERETASGPSRESGPGGPPGLDDDTLRELAAIGNNMMGMVREGVEVVRTEARLFVSSVTLLVVLAVTAGMLMAGAWLCIVAATALVLMSVGLAPWLATLIVGAVLIGLGYGTMLWMRRLVKELSFLRSREVFSELKTGESVEEGR